LETPEASARDGHLVAVQVQAEGASRVNHFEEREAAGIAASVGAIHIEFSDGQRLCVRGAVDRETLSAVIRELSRP
jgi:hypothetical protein